MLAMQRELGSFPLTPGHRQKLHNAGFLVVEDVLQVKPDELGRGEFASSSQSGVFLISALCYLFFHGCLLISQNDRFQVANTVFSLVGPTFLMN